MSTMTNQRSPGLGLMSESFSLALIYLVAVVTTLALRGAPIDPFVLLAPAVAFAAAGGFALRRYRDRRPVLLGLVAAALATGVALGLA